MQFRVNFNIRMLNFCLLLSITLSLLMRPVDCQAQREPDSLIVIVGERISIEKFEPVRSKNQILMDEAFRAEYKVLANVFSKFTGDTCRFIVYDHYGVPAFSKYKHVLLFLSYYDGKLYHEKYQYFDVYKTKNGRWASCGDPYRFDKAHPGEVVAVKLKFDKPVTFDLAGMKQEQVQRFFPEQFYEIKGGKAYCRKGAYAEQLFQIKRDGVLEARGIF